jgi:hypothetical protein
MATATQLSIQEATTLSKGGASSARYSRPAEHVRASNLSAAERKAVLADLLEDVRSQAVNAIGASGAARPDVIVVSSTVRASPEKIQELADKIAVLLSSYDSATGGNAYLIDCVLHLKP